MLNSMYSVIFKNDFCVCVPPKAWGTSPDEHDMFQNSNNTIIRIYQAEYFQAAERHPDSAERSAEARTRVEKQPSGAAVRCQCSLHPRA